MRERRVSHIFMHEGRGGYLTLLCMREEEGISLLCMRGEEGISHSYAWGERRVSHSYAWGERRVSHSYAWENESMYLSCTRGRGVSCSQAHYLREGSPMMQDGMHNIWYTFMTTTCKPCNHGNSRELYQNK